MRRLAERVWKLGIRLCVFTALILFGLMISLRETEAGTGTETGLLVSPELIVDEASGIRFFCELENESEQEIPEVNLSLRLPEGSDRQLYRFLNAELRREGAESIQYDLLSSEKPLQVHIPSLKPGEYCLLEAEGTVSDAEVSEDRRKDLELAVSLRRGEEEHTTRKRYDLSGQTKTVTAAGYSLLGERVGTVRNQEVNRQAELKQTELSAGQLELDFAREAPPAERQRPASRLPVMEILVCSIALWMLSILLKQLAIYFEEGRRKFDPKRKRSPRKKTEEDEKKS